MKQYDIKFEPLLASLYLISYSITVLILYIQSKVYTFIQVCLILIISDQFD